MNAIYTVLKNLYKHLPDIKGRHHIKELRALVSVLQTVQTYRLLYTVLPQQYKHFLKLCKIWDS